MRTWWYCLTCVAGSTENVASSLAEGHTKRTQHPTMTTTVYETWLEKMQKTASDRTGEV